MNREEEEPDMYRCSCTTHKYEPHTCPFAEEIGGDSETLCTCCSFCEGVCAQDI